MMNRREAISHAAAALAAVSPGLAIQAIDAQTRPLFVKVTPTVHLTPGQRRQIIEFLKAQFRGNGPLSGVPVIIETPELSVTVVEDPRS